MVQDRTGTRDEVIVSMLASADVVAGIVWQGLEPVFADLDPETMSLTPATVVDQLTVHTKTVLVIPNIGVLGNWESLARVTEPRGIALQVEGGGARGGWERIAPGVEGMGESLLRVDPQVIRGGAAAFAQALGAYMIYPAPLPEWRGRHRDYPGMATLEKTVITLSNWREVASAIADCASAEARQQSFLFEIPVKPPAAVPPARVHANRIAQAG